MTEQIFDVVAWNQDREGTADKNLLVSFEVKAVPQKVGAEKRFKNVEFIRVWVDKETEVVRPCTDDDRERFATRYQAWKVKGEVPIEGTPLSEWPELSPADIQSLQANRIQTVEQLSQKADTELPGFHLNLKYKSIDWLNSRVKSGVLAALRDEIDSLKAGMAVKDDKIRELNKALMRQSSEELGITEPEGGSVEEYRKPEVEVGEGPTEAGLENLRKLMDDDGT